MNFLKSKKGNLLSGETIGTILAVAVTIFLIYFFYTALAPSIDRGDISTKSLFNDLKEGIEKARSGETASFTLAGNPKDDIYVVLVYFDGKFARRVKSPLEFLYLDGSFIVRQDLAFFSPDANKNNLCVCYYDRKKKETYCNYCLDLDGRATLNSNQGGWAIVEGDTVKIKKEGDEYQFQQENARGVSGEIIWAETLSAVLDVEKKAVTLENGMTATLVGPVVHDDKVSSIYYLEFRDKDKRYYYTLYEEDFKSGEVTIYEVGEPNVK